MTIFFTVATVNYLPQAVTLLDSVKQHHPEFSCFIALADYLSADCLVNYELATRYPLVQLHELEVKEFDFITSNYNPAQLSNGTKVLFAEYFFNSYPADTVVFCDSDIMFFNRLSNLATQDHNIIITPHFTTPPPLEYKIQELEVLNAGLYNGGCVILNRSDETFGFIKWLRERSVLECVYDQARGIYGEQLWLNFLPLYFNKVHVERNIGHNMAYWNLHERQLLHDGEQYTVNRETVLVYFHFSGWDYKTPESISKWGRYSTKERPDILPLLLRYKELLDKNLMLEYTDIPNFYFEGQRQRVSDQKKLRYKIKTIIKKLFR